MSNYTRWYRYGTISLTKGSKTVVGEKTYWTTAGFNPGDILVVDKTYYEIDDVIDNTTLMLREAYSGDTVSNVGYAVIRNFTATPMSRIAAQTSEILGVHQRLLDEKLSTIQGRSAYEIAQENGFIGTEEEWLESLKAAGEYAELHNEVSEITNLIDVLGIYVDEDGDLAQDV